MSSRLLGVLFAFLPNHPTLSLADLARRTGLPHATTRRLTQELVSAGALEKGKDGRFRIGLRLWQLGTLAPRTESLRMLAQPVLEDIYAALHQHVQLAVVDGGEAVVIERQSAPDAVGLVSRVGGKLPLHCSAVGKILLAYSPPDTIDDVLSSRLRRFTSHTVIDPDALRAELATIRRTGTAFVREELSDGADSVATYVCDDGGRVVAALSVVVRAGSVALPTAVPSIVASGLRLSRVLGWRPGTPVRPSLKVPLSIE